MNRSLLKNNKGTTLVEILIYVAITSAVIGSFVSFALLIDELRIKTLSIKRVETSVTDVFALLEKKIKNSERVIEPASKATSTRLILDIANQSENITIEAIGGIVYLTEGSAAPVRITGNSIYIENFDFINLAEEGAKDAILAEIGSRYRYATSQSFEFSLSDSLIISRRY